MTGVNSRTFSIAALYGSRGGGSNRVADFFDMVKDVELRLKCS